MAVSKRTQDIIELTQWHTLADTAQSTINALEFFTYDAGRLVWSEQAGQIKNNIRLLNEEIEAERNRIMGVQ